jgi:hypothetical protein
VAVCARCFLFDFFEDFLVGRRRRVLCSSVLDVYSDSEACTRALFKLFVLFFQVVLWRLRRVAGNAVSAFHRSLLFGIRNGVVAYRSIWKEKQSHSQAL